mmetsp:Transcript_4619/g.6907  ORF Transcript_4619/g.6907 Transcript_4619/m.6907 type:complete len:206 (-) Transcript_4619:452-1069(-)
MLGGQHGQRSRQLLHLLAPLGAWLELECGRLGAHHLDREVGDAVAEAEAHTSAAKTCAIHRELWGALVDGLAGRDDGDAMRIQVRLHLRYGHAPSWRVQLQETAPRVDALENQRARVRPPDLSGLFGQEQLLRTPDHEGVVLVLLERGGELHTMDLSQTCSVNGEHGGGGVVDLGTGLPDDRSRHDSCHRHWGHEVVGPVLEGHL